MMNGSKPYALRCLSALPYAVSARRNSRTTEPDADCSLSLWERVRVRRIGLKFDRGTRTIPTIVVLRNSSDGAEVSQDDDEPFEQALGTWPQ